MPARIGLFDEFQLEVSSFRSHLASVAVVIDILRKEDRHCVFGTERLELLQNSQELRGYV